MRKSRIVLLGAVLLGGMVLSGCLYVPGQGGSIRGEVDYAITPAGPCLYPGVGIEPYGRTVVPAPGGYRRYR